MKNRTSVNSGQDYDPETGELSPEAEEELFAKEGVQPDGTTFLPKISGATIRCIPERAKLENRPVKQFFVAGIVGGLHLMPLIDDAARIESLPEDHIERMTFTALVAAIEPWGVVRYDDDGNPNKVFKSDYLFLPIAHTAYVRRFREVGQVGLALEFWTQPAGNRAGYSWYYVNLAKYDRNGLSPIDRMLRLGVVAGRALADGRGDVGLLADLRGA